MTQETLLQHLQQAGQTGQQTADYLRQRGIPIRFARGVAAAGAWWTPWRAIYINRRYFDPQTAPTPRLLCLLAHEVKHLQQGMLTALSVYGELEAWQVDFRLCQELNGNKPPHPAIAELLSLPLQMERRTLERARHLMQAYATQAYRADLLPLFPLPQEIAYWLRRR